MPSLLEGSGVEVGPPRRISLKVQVKHLPVPSAPPPDHSSEPEDEKPELQEKPTSIMSPSRPESPMRMQSPLQEAACSPDPSSALSPLSPTVSYTSSTTLNV